MSANRLRELTKTYERRRAAEVMAEIPISSNELAHEGLQVFQQRFRELEEENELLREENARLRKELDAR